MGEARKHFEYDVRLRAISILVKEGGPITARELGRRLEFRGSAETRRRDVRFLIDQLRREGQRICAEIPGGVSGYWLARDDDEWHAYLEAKRKGAAFAFVAARRFAAAAEERTTGQGKLFVTHPGAFSR